MPVSTKNAIGIHQTHAGFSRGPPKAQAGAPVTSWTWFRKKNIEIDLTCTMCRHWRHNAAENDDGTYNEGP